MKNNNCFNCLNHDQNNFIPADDTGWYIPCRLGIKNEGLQDIKHCPQYNPNNGFQIGGYYSHMHFEQDGGCLKWIIHSNGEFPQNDPEQFIQFHICDFRQIEEWVKFWGKELRKRGWIQKDEEDIKEENKK